MNYPYCPPNPCGNFDPCCLFNKLAVGTQVTIQYNDQPPAQGIFQGFQQGAVLLSHFNGFPGLTRLNARRINAVSV